MHILDLAASSAIFCASLSRTNSASIDISVFHSLRPPKSFSPPLAGDEIARALVAAINIAIELLLYILIFLYLLF